MLKYRTISVESWREGEGEGGEGPKRGYRIEVVWAALIRIEEMREALGVYTSRAAERLRKARMVANGVTVWGQTNTFIEGEPQYANSAFGALPGASAHTGEILRIALQVLERIFRKGYRYKKAGVMLSGLEPVGCRQLSLLSPAPTSDPKAERLMAVLNQANARWGRDTIRLAACGIK